MAIIDCCTRALVAWHLSVRCRAEEAITLVEEAAAAHGIQEGELTLGSDNGSALTARRFKVRLAEQGIRHRRGGYRDPESQAFIESWLGKLKERELWLNQPLPLKAEVFVVLEDQVDEVVAADQPEVLAVAAKVLCFLGERARGHEQAKLGSSWGKCAREFL